MNFILQTLPYWFLYSQFILTKISMNRSGMIFNEFRKIFAFLLPQPFKTLWLDDLFFKSLDWIHIFLWSNHNKNHFCIKYTKYFLQHTFTNETRASCYQNCLSFKKIMDVLRLNIHKFYVLIKSVEYKNNIFVLWMFTIILNNFCLTELIIKSFIITSTRKNTNSESIQLARTEYIFLFRIMISGI